MGEGRNGGGAPGRPWTSGPDEEGHAGSEGGNGGRSGRPWTSGPREEDGHAGLAALLEAALRTGDPDPEAEQRAVTAFRAARDAGAHRARTRRRDDWRPRTRGASLRSARATLAVLLGGLTLGGVAFAAIGGSDAAPSSRPAPGAASTGPGLTGPPPSAPDAAPAPSGSASRPGSASVSGASDPSAAAQDEEARCRAYEQVAGRGRAMDAEAWRRLVDAAGGEDRVDAYCADRLTPAAGRTAPGATVPPAAPAPTDVPVPTGAPVPTGVPVPTGIPVPTGVPVPTGALVPTGPGVVPSQDGGIGGGTGEAPDAVERTRGSGGQ
jgi:hypothetical protein